MREYLLKLKESQGLIGLNNVVAETYRRSMSFNEAVLVVKNMIKDGELSESDLKQSLSEQIARIN